MQDQMKDVTDPWMDTLYHEEETGGLEEAAYLKNANYVA